MRAVKEARAQIVVGVVVDSHETFGAVGIAEYPGFELLLDQFLLLAGGQCFLLVDDALLAAAVKNRVVDDRVLRLRACSKRLMPPILGVPKSEVAATEAVAL